MDALFNPLPTPHFISWLCLDLSIAKGLDTTDVIYAIPLSKHTVKLSTRLFIFKQRSNELPKETPSSEGSERQCDDEICLTNHPDYPLTMIQQGLTRHGTLDDKKAFSSLVSLILIMEHWKSGPTRPSKLCQIARFHSSDRAAATRR